MEGEGQRRRDINQRSKIKNHKDGISGGRLCLSVFQDKFIIIISCNLLAKISKGQGEAEEEGGERD